MKTGRARIEGTVFSQDQKVTTKDETAAERLLEEETGRWRESERGIEEERFRRRVGDWREGWRLKERESEREREREREREKEGGGGE